MEKNFIYGESFMRIDVWCSLFIVIKNWNQSKCATIVHDDINALG